MTTSPIPHTAVLKRHPGTDTESVRGIETRVSWNGDGVLAFHYLLLGDLSRLRIPPPRAARRADRLWERTCFEAFVSVKDGPAYYELNFAPSGEWAIYAFERYRERAPLEEEALFPKTAVHTAKERLELEAIVGLDRLPAIKRAAPLRLALSAVIEENSGKLSYWALNHPPGKPDFHHPDGFALELEPGGGIGIDETATRKR